MSTSESSLEILESSTYFTYVYVPCNKAGFPKDVFFTVQLTINSKDVLCVLKGPKGGHTFVNLGRPYYLEKGTRLRLQINDKLNYLDINKTYWGLFKL